MATVNDDLLPAREDIAERLEAQRTRIWHVLGVCGLAASAGRHYRNDGEDSATAFATDVWTAMEGVTALLNEIGGALEPDVLLTTKEASAASVAQAPDFDDLSAWRRGAELAFSMLRQIEGCSLDETAYEGDERGYRPQANFLAGYLAELKKETDPRCELAFAAILTDHIASAMHSGPPILEGARKHYAGSPIASAPTTVQP